MPMPICALPLLNERVDDSWLAPLGKRDEAVSGGGAEKERICERGGAERETEREVQRGKRKEIHR